MPRIEQKRTVLTAAYLVILAIAIAVSHVRLADAAGTPAQQCQAGKNKAAGKYSSCLANAQAKYVSGADFSKYSDALDRCETKFSTAWEKLEAKAAGFGVGCPDSPLSEGAVQTAIVEHNGILATALAGGGLQVCGNGTVESSEQCDGGNLDSKRCDTVGGFAGGTLRCSSGCTFDTSACWVSQYVDNGDGTVTDNLFGLQWEKKTGTLPGANVSCIPPTDCTSDPHNVRNQYSWSATVGGTTPTGTVFTQFLFALNGNTSNSCFAGKCDWRLPTDVELQDITDGDYCSGLNGCIDPIFGPTVHPSSGGGHYWAINSTGANAFYQDFLSGGSGAEAKGAFPRKARAVRTLNQ